MRRMRREIEPGEIKIRNFLRIGVKVEKIQCAVIT